MTENAPIDEVQNDRRRFVVRRRETAVAGLSPSGARKSPSRGRNLSSIPTPYIARICRRETTDGGVEGFKVADLKRAIDRSQKIKVCRLKDYVLPGAHLGHIMGVP
jgi:hypothetical protein